MKTRIAPFSRRQFIRFGMTAMFQAMFFSWTSLAGAVTKTSHPEEWKKRILNSSQFKDGKFVNPIHAPIMAKGSTWSYIKKRFFQTRKDPAPEGTLPVKQLKKKDWLDRKEKTLQFAWMGHSSILISLDNKSILVDPVLEDRASPFTWIGPRRFHPPPVTAAALPKIDVVLITHDHYDHLEKSTIEQLRKSTGVFIVPLGIGNLLLDWGVLPEKIVVLDWWEHHQIDTLKIMATPGVHYARRGLFDGDERLWCSFAVQGKGQNVFISGDSGYFDEFKKIGEQMGPFDATFLKIGSYDESWKQIHMLPEEAVQQHMDLKGRVLVPLHWATFDLALHSWYEPIERMMVEAVKKGIQYVTPLIGEPINVSQLPVPHQWWRHVDKNS